MDAFQGDQLDQPVKRFCSGGSRASAGIRAQELTPSHLDSIPQQTGPIKVLLVIRHPSKRKVREGRLLRIARYPETFVCEKIVREYYRYGSVLAGSRSFGGEETSSVQGGMAPEGWMERILFVSLFIPLPEFFCAEWFGEGFLMTCEFVIFQTSPE